MTHLVSMSWQYDVYHQVFLLGSPFTCSRVVWSLVVHVTSLIVRPRALVPHWTTEGLSVVYLSVYSKYVTSQEEGSVCGYHV